MNETLQKLLEQIQHAGPVVWDAAYRQVRVELYELVGAFCFLTLALVICWVISFFLERSDAIGLRVGASLVYTIVFIPLVLSASDYYFNPTWQAIDKIKGLVVR